MKIRSILVYLFLCILFSFSTAFATDNDDSHTAFYASSLIGGGSGSLDGAISGVSIGPYDIAIVRTSESGVSVTRFYNVTLTSETEDVPTVIRPDDVGAGVTSWHIMDFGYPKTVSMNMLRSGASPVTYAPDSGTSIEAKYFNTIIWHNQATSTVYGLSPISGTSCVYIKFIETASAGGITVYNVNGEPFHGNGLSGTSYLALPPDNPHESATVYSVDVSGTSPQWYVEASSNWIAGN